MNQYITVISGAFVIIICVSHRSLPIPNTTALTHGHAAWYTNKAAGIAVAIMATKPDNDIIIMFLSLMRTA